MTRSLLRTAAVALATMLTVACGGPLSHTVEGYSPDAVGAEQRAAIDKLQADAEAAAQARDDAKLAAIRAEESHDQAEDAAEQADADLEVAKAALNLAETKDDAGHAADVESAKANVERHEKGLAIAKKTAEVAEARHEFSDRKRVETRKAWIVALAARELAKFETKKGKGPDHEEKHAAFKTQLDEAKKDLEDAAKEAAEAKQELDDAQEELNAAKSQ